MNRRQAKRIALDSAAGILQSTVDGGWPDDYDDDADAFAKIQAAMTELADELARRGRGRVFP